MKSKPLSPKKRITAAQRRQALLEESERALKERNQAQLALPPDRRTNFLRVKIGVTGTAL